MLAEAPVHTPKCPLTSTQSPVKHPGFHVLLTVLKRDQSSRIGALHVRDGGKNACKHAHTHTHTHSRMYTKTQALVHTLRASSPSSSRVFRALR